MGLKRIFDSFYEYPGGVGKYVRMQFFPGSSAESPIFVAGPPRSGTTMLYTRITSYKEFSGPYDETGFFMLTNPYLVPMYPMPASQWILNVALSKTQAQLLDAAIRWFKLNMHSNFFVEKTPQHCLYYRRIFKIWPNAKIVSIIRHPLDCVASSIRNKDFIPQGNNIIEAAKYWAKCAKSIQKMSNMMNCKVIRYEDFVSNSNSINRLMHFLTKDKIDSVPQREIQHAFLGRRGFELLSSPEQAVRVGTWSEILSVEEASLVWSIVGDVAVKFRYQLQI